MKLFTELQENVGVTVITEELDNGVKKKNYYIEGVFLQSNIKNRNNRIYEKRIMDMAVDRYITEQVKTNRAVGELSHPSGPQINYDRVSHKIVSLKEDGNNYIGKAKITSDTPCGKIVKSLIDEGISFGVSSRGMGSLVERNGAMYVGEDFTLATAADIVADPSAPDAWVNGVMEGKEWVYVDGRYLEKDIDTAKRTIETATRQQNLAEIKKSAFIDFINRL